MALKLLPNGRWQNTQTGRFAKAPVLTASGRYKDPATGKFVKVQTPITPTKAGLKSPIAARAAVKTVSPNIITGEQFAKKYGGLPPVEYSTSEAMRFKRGVTNMGVVHESSRKNQLKIRKMDADKLLVLYNDNPTLFDLYFEYNPDAFGLSGYFEDNEGDVVDLLIEKYESRFGVIK